MTTAERHRQFFVVIVITIIVSALAATVGGTVVLMQQLRHLEVQHTTLQAQFQQLMVKVDENSIKTNSAIADMSPEIRNSAKDVMVELMRLHRRQEQIQVDVMAGKLKRQLFENETLLWVSVFDEKILDVSRMVKQYSSVIIDHLSTLKTALVQQNATVTLMQQRIPWGRASQLSTATCLVDEKSANVIDATVQWRLQRSPASLPYMDTNSNCYKQFRNSGQSAPFRGLLKLYLYDASASPFDKVMDWFHVAEIDVNVPLVLQRKVDSLETVAEQPTNHTVATHLNYQTTALLSSGAEIPMDILKSHWFSRTLRFENLPPARIAVKAALSFRTYNRACNFSTNAKRDPPTTVEVYDDSWFFVNDSIDICVVV